MVKFIYKGQEPYITADERKLTENDIGLLKKFLTDIRIEYFNFFINRVLADDLIFFAKIDRIALIIMKPFARFLAGRILLKGIINK